MCSFETTASSISCDKMLCKHSDKRYNKIYNRDMAAYEVVFVGFPV